MQAASSEPRTVAHTMHRTRRRKRRQRCDPGSPEGVGLQLYRRRRGRNSGREEATHLRGRTRSEASAACPARDTESVRGHARCLASQRRSVNPARCPPRTYRGNGSGSCAGRGVIPWGQHGSTRFSASEQQRGGVASLCHWSEDSEYVRGGQQAHSYSTSSGCNSPSHWPSDCADGFKPGPSPCEHRRQHLWKASDVIDVARRQKALSVAR